MTVKLHHEQSPILVTTQVRVVFVRNDAEGWVHGCQFMQRLEDRDLQLLAT